MQASKEAVHMCERNDMHAISHRRPHLIHFSILVSAAHIQDEVNNVVVK